MFKPYNNNFGEQVATKLSQEFGKMPSNCGYTATLIQDLMGDVL